MVEKLCWGAWEERESSTRVRITKAETGVKRGAGSPGLAGLVPRTPSAFSKVVAPIRGFTLHGFSYPQ